MDFSSTTVHINLLDCKVLSMLNNYTHTCIKDSGPMYVHITDSSSPYCDNVRPMIRFVLKIPVSSILLCNQLGSWAILHRVCSSEIKLVTSTLLWFSSLFSLWLKANQCKKSNSNGCCASQLLAPTQRSSSFQTAVEF